MVQYIVVEGPIGAGKTSLAEKLARLLDAELMLERPMPTPSCPGSMKIAGNAQPTQLAFLLSRFDQCRQLVQGELFGRARVADFLLDKDALFAHMNLDEAEFRL